MLRDRGYGVERQPVARVDLEAGRSRYASSLLQAGKLAR